MHVHILLHKKVLLIKMLYSEKKNYHIRVYLLVEKVWLIKVLRWKPVGWIQIDESKHTWATVILNSMNPFLRWGQKSRLQTLQLLECFSIITSCCMDLYMYMKNINPNHPESIKIHPPVLEDFGGFRIPPHWACGGFWWIRISIVFNCLVMLVDGL